MSNAQSSTTEIARRDQVAQHANQAAMRYMFDEYKSRKAANTLKRQAGDLALFAQFLQSVDFATDALQDNPAAWRGISWGLVEAFVKWQLAQGYAVGSVNVRLSTVKTYARLAMKAGVLTAEGYSHIKAVVGYGRTEGENVDAKRPRTRKAIADGGRKARAVAIDAAAAVRLKQQLDTPQGRRDALLMCLLLDHGLRAGEAAILTVNDFNLPAGTLTFYRPKTQAWSTHKLTADTLRAAHNWFARSHAPAVGPVLRSSRKGGRLTHAGMSARAITTRVRELGKAIGLEGLSAHDCRHSWATDAAQHSSVDALMHAGGWNSPAMPLRYVSAGAIQNEGIRLTR